MFSVIVSDRKSDMENRQAIRPEQRKLFPSDYFSRNFSLMIISLNCRIFTPVYFVRRLRDTEASLQNYGSISYKYIYGKSNRFVGRKWQGITACHHKQLERWKESV